jgi:uncharacterized LabA/DUF88 family protein
MEQINYAAHLDQRVAVFIDTQNLYHSARANYRSNVNYHELMNRAVNGRKLIRAFAYVIKSVESTEEKFFEAIEEIGIEIRVKDLQVFHTGAKKADWDVGIAVDMIRLTDKVDVVVLASGDGDFIEVVRYCKSHGVRVEVMAFEKTTNAKLMEECDNFIDLGDHNSNFLISPKRRGTTGRSTVKPGYQQGPAVLDQDNIFVAYAEPQQSSQTMPHTTSHQVASGLTIQESSNPYSGSNLSTVNRMVPKKQIDPSIYGKNLNRKVKPVVGMPAKQNSSVYSGKVLINDETKHKQSIENAFGNAVPKIRKKLY